MPIAFDDYFGDKWVMHNAWTLHPIVLLHSAKRTIRKLGEGVYSEVFCYQEGSEKLVVKVTSSHCIIWRIVTYILIQI